VRGQFLPAAAAIGLVTGLSAAPATAGPTSPLKARFTYHGHQFSLRSTSLRQVTLFKVNVYWVGLYMETEETAPARTGGPRPAKAFVFHFLRDVKSDKIQKGWIEDLSECCESGCSPVIDQGKALAKRLPDVRSSQEIAYVLFDDRVDVLIDGALLGSLEGAPASRAVLATFLGPKAPWDLRRDLIGPLVSQARE
jgi:hypothetical protein